MINKPNYDPKKHYRDSIRLKGHNYSSEGFYFVTICTEGRRCLFDTIINGEMVLNDYGKIVDNEWKNTIKIRNEDVVLHEYVIMRMFYRNIPTQSLPSLCQRFFPTSPNLLP